MPEVKIPILIPVQGVRNDLDYIGDQSTLGGRSVAADALSQSENWVYRDGVFTIRRGSEAYGTGSVGRPMGYAQFETTAGAFATVCGTDVGWRSFNNATWAWDNITGGALTGASTQQVVFRVFQKSATQYLIGINGANTMKKWDGVAATYSDAAGTPPRATAMMIVANRLILLSLLSGGTISRQAFDVSAFNDFEAGWGATLTGLLSDTSGDIIAALEMGDLTGVVYKTDAIYVFNASGGSAPYEIHLKAKGIPGPVSANAVFSLPDGSHGYFANDGTLRRFDGVSLTTIGLNDGRAIQKYYLRVAEPTQTAKTFAYYDSRNKEIWVHFAGLGLTENDRALCVKLDSGALWPMRWAALRFSAGYAGVDYRTGHLNLYQRIVFYGQTDATQRNETVYVDSTTLFTDNAAQIPTFWQTGMMDPAALGFGRPGAWMTLNEIDHILAGAAASSATSSNLAFKVFTESYGSFGDVGDAGMSISPRAVGPYITSHRKTGRGFAVRCDLTTDCNNIQYRGAVMTLVQRGLR